MPDIKISIITASFNNIDTIEDTIKSVISQSYTNIEYIIIDGGSVDGSLELFKKNYGQHITHLVSEPDKGMYDALNKGIQKASGDIIAFLHADDFYASNSIVEDAVKLFDKDNCDAVYGDLQYVYKNNPEKVLRNWISGAFHINKMKKGWMPPHPTLIIKKEFYSNHGLFDISYKVAADYDLMTRFICLHNMHPSYLPKVMIKMRWGGKSNKSIKNIVIKMQDDYKAIKKNKVGNLYTLFLKNFSKIGQFFKK